MIFGLNSSKAGNYEGFKLQSFIIIILFNLVE